MEQNPIVNVKKQEIISKEAKSGKINHADFEIFENSGGVQVSLEVKDIAEGDKAIVSVIQAAVKSAIENGGQAMFTSGGDDKESFAEFLSAKAIAKYLRFVLNPEIFANSPMVLNIKDRFGTETREELTQ